MPDINLTIIIIIIIIKTAISISPVVAKKQILLIKNCTLKSIRILVITIAAFIANNLG